MQIVWLKVLDKQKIGVHNQDANWGFLIFWVCCFVVVE